MSKSVLMNIETDGIKHSDTRLQPFVTWLQFMNFITVAVLSLIFLKVYNGILLLYEWIFPSKYNKLRYPLILVIGSNSELNEEIILQLSRLFDSEIVHLNDVNDNRIAFKISKETEKRSQIICSHIGITDQENVIKLSKYVQDTYGDIDVLLVSQNEEPLDNSNTHSFLNNLNTQLLVQFWTVMAFLPKMLQKNKGRIVSIALSRTSNLTNTGIMRTVYEELLQTDTRVKLTLVERNRFLENYLPSLPTEVLARLIITSIWNSSSIITVPSLFYYILISPLLLTRLMSRLVLKPVWRILSIAFTRHHNQKIFH